MFSKIKKYSFHLILIALTYWLLWIFDGPLGYAYDFISQQQAIESIEELETQFKSFQILSYEELPERKKQSLHSDDEKTCYGIDKTIFYKDHRFLKVSWFNRYKFLVADYRVRDFMSGSHFFVNTPSFPHLDKTQYIPLDKKILHRILHLKKELEAKGFHGDQIGINSGFRTPFYNEAVGGKICSRHQFGDAVDIRVYDINDDLKADAEDAKIVYDLLDAKVIGNKGGLGKYKSDANVLHFDTRGRRARWHY